MTIVVTAVLAAHPEASLSPSNFELDVDANLKVDDTADPLSVDWASLAHPNGPELRATDAATGQNDDSYKGGVKEDTACPGETTGSIPNNKSDLLTFSTYQEPGIGSHPGFLHLAWSRVTDPSGTTLMDFEFNQSDVDCATGPNNVRTAGDLLIEYAIDQGGSRADLTARTWTGSAWGAPADLDAPSVACGNNPCAAGTINTSAIPFGESDGLITAGQKEARTFGEATIDLRLIFSGTSCRSFGSAMIKSRSSDSFTSQLKDFIRPLDISLTNCGQVIVRKATVPAGSDAVFSYAKTFPTDPTTANTFTMTGNPTGGANVTTFSNVLIGSGYTVSETLGSLPAGWEFVGVDCSASSGVTPSINGAVVTFAIDSPSDVLDCTFTNRALFRVITFVCSQGDNTLVASDVTFEDSTKTTLESLPTGLSESVLCGLTTGASFGDKSVGTFGDDDNKVVIPAAP